MSMEEDIRIAESVRVNIPVTDDDWGVLAKVEKSYVRRVIDSG